MKRCRKCQQDLPRDAFGRNAGRLDGLQWWCKECSNAHNRARYAEDPEAQQRRTQQWRDQNPGRQEALRLPHVLARYGLTVDAYHSMVIGQASGCAVCRYVPQDGDRQRRLAVDHCHRTGRVRGLLCDRCNRNIGHFDDDPDLLQVAVDYLRRAELPNV